MATTQHADGSSAAADRGNGQPRRGRRLAAIILAATSAIVAVIGLVSSVGRFLFPLTLPGAAVQLLEAGVILLVPAAILAAISAALALGSRARATAACAAGTLAVCLLFIGATGYLYRDFSARQGLAAWQCRPGYRLAFSCQSAARADSSRDADSLQGAKLVVARRLDPLALGAARVTATPPDRMMVRLDRRVVPRRQERMEGLVRLVEQPGVLEFRILPTIDRDELSRDRIEQYRQALRDKGARPASDNLYVWVAIRDVNEWHSPASIVEQSGDKHYVLASNRSDEVMLYGPDGGRWSIETAYPTADSMGRKAIGFRLDEQGGNLFWDLTARNGGRPLAIVLDSVVISAPTINPDSPIGRNGIIMGTFTVEEVSDMAAILNCKPLPLELRLAEGCWQD